MEKIKAHSLIRLENPQGFDSHQWITLMATPNSKSSAGKIKSYKHSVGFLSLIDNEPALITTLNTDYALFATLSSTLCSPTLNENPSMPFHDHNSIKIMMHQQLEAIAKDMATYRLWRLNAGVPQNEIIAHTLTQFGFKQSSDNGNYEWFNPQFNKDMAMAL